MPPWESRQKLGSPNVGHPSVQCQPAASGMHAVGDLDTTDVHRVFSFNPPCREDRGDAIYLEFVFGAVKYLDPRFVCRESYWVGDTIIQVGKWPLWWKLRGGGGGEGESFLSFWNGLIEDGPWLVLSASISSIRSSIVAMAPDGHIPCITFL